MIDQPRHELWKSAATLLTFAYVALHNKFNRCGYKLTKNALPQDGHAGCNSMPAPSSDLLLQLPWPPQCAACQKMEIRSLSVAFLHQRICMLQAAKANILHCKHSNCGFILLPTLHS